MATVIPVTADYGSQKIATPKNFLSTNIAGSNVVANADGTLTINLPPVPPEASVASAGRNLVIQSASTTQAVVMADEMVLKNASNVPLLVRNVNFTLDITLGVALNGFETGAVRGVSRWYYIWMISNGSNVRGVLEDAGAGDGILPGGPDLSGGVFAGYTYMAIVGQIRLNATGSGDMVAFAQFDRTVWIEDALIFTGQIAAVNDAWEVLAGANLTNFRAAVPPTGRSCRGSVGSIATNQNGFIVLGGGNADGTLNSTVPIGTVYVTLNVLATLNAGFTSATDYSIPVRGGAGRNIQWKTNRPDAIGRARLFVSGYTF